MAREKLTEVTTDLIADAGTVLWSFIKGEQLEYPITLDFLNGAATTGYVFEAVVVEALNVLDQQERPTTIKPSGVQNTLVVRQPDFQGAWSALTEYNYEEVVSYGGKYYRLLSGVAYTSATTPNLDAVWEETTLSRIYVQFPSSLGATYAVQPTVLGSVYGFFELRVTEPNNSVFVKTWKPVRGMVELLFSPSDIVAG
jgi:hypothetical protein